jgi:hypothetical protein
MSLEFNLNKLLKKILFPTIGSPAFILCPLTIIRSPREHIATVGSDGICGMNLLKKRLPPPEKRKKVAKIITYCLIENNCF